MIMYGVMIRSTGSVVAKIPIPKHPSWPAARLERKRGGGGKLSIGKEIRIQVNARYKGAVRAAFQYI